MREKFNNGTGGLKELNRAESKLKILLLRKQGAPEAAVIGEEIRQAREELRMIKIEFEAGAVPPGPFMVKAAAAR